MLKQFLIDVRVRLAAVFARRALRERADEEVQFHLCTVERRLIESGTPPEIARAQARRQFGNPTLIKEQTFDSWRYTSVDWVERLSQDLQLTLRMMGARPWFAVSTVLLLALGIGVNTVMFSVVDAVWLRPLPYVDSNRLVAVWEKPARNVKWKRQMLPWSDFQDLRRDSQTFEVLVAASPCKYTAVLNDRAESVTGEAITAGYMAMLGIAALQGRTILPDDHPGAPAAVLSYRLWQRSYGSRTVVGQTLRLDSRSYTILGVMPPTFTFPSLDEGPPDLWTILTSNAESLQKNGGRVSVIGRLRPSVTAKAAEDESTALLRQVHDRVPVAWRPQGMIVRDLQSDRAEFSTPMLAALICAVTLVLLIACANVAGLLLGRAAERRQEMAVRYALGAGQARIVRQLLTENIVIWMVAGAAGMALAATCLYMFLPYVSRVLEDFPQLNPIAVNSRAAVYALLLTLTTGTLFGLAPALQASRLDIAGALKEGGRSLMSGRHAHYWRKALVACEVGFCVVLLIGAGLLTKSLVQLATQPLGFRAGNDMTFKVELSGDGYKEPGQRYRFYDRLLETLTNLPGVEYAGATSALPLKGTVVFGCSILGHSAVPSDSMLAGNEAISPGYFQAIGIPVLRGRAFDARDSELAVRVAVVNQTLAQR
jgi:predicted permease